MISTFGNSLWYAAGLAFECQQCGRCCAGPEEGYVWICEDEMVRLAGFLGISPEQVRKQYTRRVGGRYTIIEHPKTHDCIFLQPNGSCGGKGKGCSIYDVRHAQCRTWPFWRSNLSSPEDWAIANERCPGINRGRLFQLDEIIVRRDASDT